MSDEVLVLVGEDPQLVEGQDSAKTGCPSVMPKRLFGFSSSWWLSGPRVVKCGLDRWFERTGLKVCKQKRGKHFVMTMKEKMRIRCVLQYTKVYFKHTVFLSFFDREWVRDGW